MLRSKETVILQFISWKLCIITNFLACKINKLIESLLFKHEIKRDRWANKSQLIPPFLAILLYVREIALWVLRNKCNEPKHRKTMLQISKNYRKLSKKVKWRGSTLVHLGVDCFLVFVHTLQLYKFHPVFVEVIKVS